MEKIGEIGNFYAKEIPIIFFIRLVSGFLWEFLHF